MKGRLVLIALFGLFIAPVLVAVILNSRWVDWQASPDRAHGTLIQPVQPIGNFSLPDTGGEPRTQDDLTGYWWLVHIAGPQCQRCLETIEVMRNIRLAQDRRFDDLKLMLLAPGEFRAPAGRSLGPEWLTFSSDAARRLASRFPDPVAGASYIVDPRGNIIESFAPRADPTGIRKDLDRLLTWTVRE